MRFYTIYDKLESVIVFGWDVYNGLTFIASGHTKPKNPGQNQDL